MRNAGILIAFLVFTGCGGGDDSPVTSDTTPPTVVATSPADAADNVAVEAEITATFSEDMNPSTIAASTFLVSDGVFGSVSYGNKTATLTPSQELEENFLYTARLTTAIKDEAGNALIADVVWSFTTAGDAILPLRTDNYWTAQNTVYDVQGNEYASSETTRWIVRYTIISGERWYIDQSDDLYINQADGLHQRTDAGSSYLFLKYPATVGQSYPANPVTNETIIVKATDTSITVPAGTYSCYMYERRTAGSTTLVNYFYSPNIGPIRFETWNASADPLIRRGLWELKSFDLQ